MRCAGAGAGGRGGAEVVGRESQLAAVREFTGAAGDSRRALVLTGAPGIGKTTLWEAGIDAARDRGLHVLSARPSDAEAQLSFAALIDLFDGVDADALEGLPAPQRSALEVALLRREPTGVPPEPHAIALGLLNGLRALAARAPLVVASDDVQWLDPPSAGALAFAARRLDAEPVRFLLARRPGAPSALERWAPERLDVGPLSLDETRRLLSERLGLSLSRRLLRRVVETTLGNPLFALEVGRTLIERGSPEIGADIPVPDEVEEMLGTRVARLPDPVRRLLLAVALSADLRTAELEAVGDQSAVEEALDTGLLLVEGDRVRPSHPLLTTAATRHSRPQERRAPHLALADAVPDQQRAMHLALATERPEAELAETVAAAAAGASARGARRGRPIDDVCERFRGTSDAAFHLTDSPEPVAGLRLVWRGELEPARATLTRFLSLADERGEAVSYAWLRLNLCELELRAGAWEAASRLLDEWGESDDGQLLITPTYQRCRALLAAGRGLPEEADRWAAPALADAERRGYRWQVLESLRALGISALLAHEPARAAERLRAVWAHTLREGVDDPGAFPVAPELVEALVELGELGEAHVVTARLRELAESQQHPWGRATAKRCGAVVQLASGDYDEQAATELAHAAADFQRLGLRFDRARALLGLGRAQRRAKKWRAARESLERAVAAFDEIGSTGWAEQARAELARVGARRPRVAGELTPTEQRVARLAADGRSNKEIAHALYITVHTVETHLSNTYAKLGVRSRTQLAGRLSAQA